MNIDCLKTNKLNSQQSRNCIEYFSPWTKNPRKVQDSPHPGIDTRTICKKLMVQEGAWHNDPAQERHLTQDSDQLK